MAMGQTGELYEEWLELRNGCLCCSVKDNGIQAIERLMEKKGRFDYILLETTGLADPGPIASIFWLDDELGCNIYLDGIITVVDAKYSLNQLLEKKPDKVINEAVRQVALADLVLLNKVDLVDKNLIMKTENHIKSINSLADIVHTVKAKVDLQKILDLHAYDTSKYQGFRTERFQATSSHIDPFIVSVTFEVFGSITSVDLDSYIQNLLWDKSVCNPNGNPMEILRMKGEVSLVAEARRVIVQAVNELYDREVTTPWEADSARKCTLVFIGRNLDEKVLRQKFTDLIGLA